MSEKKTLHNVWLIQDKVPTDDPKSKPHYFAGWTESNISGGYVSRFEPLSADTKTYNTPKKAKIGAIRAAKYYESPYLIPVFFEEIVIPCKPKSNSEELAASHPLLPVPESEYSGWIKLSQLCPKYPVMMLKKKVGNVVRYAIYFSATDIRYLPADVAFAWTRYFEECTNFVVSRIRERRIAEGKDPDGADDWKKGSGT